MIEIDSPIVKNSITMMEKKIQHAIEACWEVDTIKNMVETRNLLLEPYVRMQAPILKLVQENNNIPK